MSQAFEQLTTFIKSKMKMAHVYQPVFIKTLLENGGSATCNIIAKEILTFDVAQQEYYEHIVKTMPAKIFRRVLA